MALVPVGRLLSVVRQLKVRVPALALARSLDARCGIADEHAEAGRERGHGRVVRIRVLDGYAAGAGFEARVGVLGDAVVGAMAPAGAEEDGLRPVVGKIVGEGAGCAVGLGRDVY